VWSKELRFVIQVKVGRSSGSDRQLSEVEPAEEAPGPTGRNSPLREAQSGGGGGGRWKFPPIPIFHFRTYIGLYRCRADNIVHP